MQKNYLVRLSFSRFYYVCALQCVCVLGRVHVHMCAQGPGRMPWKWSSTQFSQQADQCRCWRLTDHLQVHQVFLMAKLVFQPPTPSLSFRSLKIQTSFESLYFKYVFGNSIHTAFVCLFFPSLRDSCLLRK